jgi:uncharacterized integral membrane protein
MRWLKRFFLYASLLAVAVFAAINGQSVKVDLLAAEWELSLGVLLILVLITGMAMGVLVGSVLFARRIHRQADATADRQHV